MIKPGNKIEPVKIKSFKYLINQIKKKHTETESPKHALLIGAGCSYKCGIPLGSQIIELCKIHSFIENEIIQPPNFWYLNPIKFNFEELEKYLKQKKEWDNFQKYVKEKESYLKELVVRDKDIYLNRIISIFGALAEDEKKGIW